MVFLATKSFTYHNKYSISDGKKTSKICDLWQTFFLQNLHFLVAKSFSLPVGSGRLRVPETPGAAPRKQMAMNLEALSDGIKELWRPSSSSRKHSVVASMGVAAAAVDGCRQ